MTSFDLKFLGLNDLVLLDRIWACAGKNETMFIRDCESYAPEDGWRPEPDMMESRFDHSAAVTVHGMYLFGSKAGKRAYGSSGTRAKNHESTDGSMNGSKRPERLLFELDIFNSGKVKQHIARNIFQPHHKEALMVDLSILNGRPVLSYLSHYMVFPQLFSMTIYMFLVGFILIREGMMLIKLCIFTI